MTPGAARLLLVFAACGSGCAATTLDAVRDTAALELGCPPDQIRVEDQGDSHFRAVGCRKSARYATHPPGRCTRPTCRLAEH